MNDNNDIRIDKGGVLNSSPSTALNILNAKAQQERNLDQQKQQVLELSNSLTQMDNQLSSLVSKLSKIKDAPADLKNQLKEANKSLNSMRDIADQVNTTYERGNANLDDWNDLIISIKESLLQAQLVSGNITDTYDEQNKKLRTQLDYEKNINTYRRTRVNQFKEDTKALQNERKELNKLSKESRKSMSEALRKDISGLKKFIMDTKNTLNLESLSKNAQMTSTQQLQYQMETMYGFGNRGIIGSDFQRWRKQAKSGLDSTLYNSEDFKNAIAVLPELNLNLAKATDLMPTLVRGQKLLGMTSDEQVKLASLSYRTGHDMLTYTTNRIAQYMKNDNNLNMKQLNEMISMNANLATQAADYGISSPKFMNSLTNATKAMTDVFGQGSGKDQVYQNAIQSIFSNYENAALAYGMSEGQMQQYLDNGGSLYDLNKSGRGAAGSLYSQLMNNYDAVNADWQKYSSVVGDQNLANLVRAQVEAQRRGQDLSSLTSANASTAKDQTALNDIEKKYGENLSLTQKAYSWFSNWVDNNFDWVTTENFYKNVIALLTSIEAALAVKDLIGGIKGLFGKGSGGSGLGSKLLGSASKGTGAMGLLSKVGAGAHLLPNGAGAAAGTTGSALAGAGVLASGAVGLGMLGYDAYQGYKEGGVGQALKRGFLGNADFKKKSAGDNVKAVGGNTLKGAALGAAVGSVIPGVGTLVGGLVGGAAGLIGGLFGGLFGNDAKKAEREKQEKLKEIAKNTASSAESMEALRNSQQLTGNSYASSVPRKALLADSTLSTVDLTKKTPSPTNVNGTFSNGYQPTSANGSDKLKKTGHKVKDVWGDTAKVNGDQNVWTDGSDNYYVWRGDGKGGGRYIDVTGAYTKWKDSGKLMEMHWSYGSTSAPKTPLPNLNSHSKPYGVGSTTSPAGNPYPWRVSAGFDRYPSGDYHNGMDFGIAEGTKIGAAKPGIIEKAQTDDRNTYPNGSTAAGTGVWVRGDDGNRYFYWHMSKLAVKQGDRVDKGTLLGYSGNTGYSTGPHLHFGVQTPNGNYIEPANFVTDGLFNASGASYDPSMKNATPGKNTAVDGSSINDILTSTYSVKLSSYQGKVGVGAGPDGGSFSTNSSNSLSDVVSGLSEIKQTLIDLSDRQTKDERIMNMLSRQTRQDPRLS